MPSALLARWCLAYRNRFQYGCCVQRPWGVACESLWRACESEGGTQRASSGEGGTQRAPSGRPFTRCPLGAIHPVERALCGSESGSRAFEGSSALTRCLTSGRWAPGASAVCTRGARATFCLYLCTVLYSIARYKKHPVKALKLWRGHATQGGSELPPPLPLGARLPFLSPWHTSHVRTLHARRCQPSSRPYAGYE